ncbi:FMN-binding negative transcriptional regulator [Silicimonas sp. MF1-12-2]|uniref:FMN-binding negative transcriptional regulator n=1 Tax=Silicimonas sp. MF1-12-2 TaxID=3384793 RepID=UPI0039B55FA4
MYLPQMFREERIEVLHQLIRTHPLGALVTHTGGALSADHVPLLLDAGPDGKDRLRGHLAAANPLCKADPGDLDVLVIFQGPQTYVSPSWYPSKQEHGKVVPTWNYAVVHVEGTLRFHRASDWLHTQVTDLTDRHEASRDLPWAVSDAPDDFVDRQLRAIVGIEIAVRTITGKWKVSQNRAPADRNGVARGLDATPTPDSAAMARLVRDSER